MPSITATVLPFSQVGRVGLNQPSKVNEHHKNCTRLRNVSTSQKILETNFQRLKTQKYGIGRYDEKLPGLAEEESLIKSDDEKHSSKADICTKFNEQSTCLINKQQRIPIRASKVNFIL